MRLAFRHSRPLAIAATLLALIGSGCATRGQTGALVGSGIGTLAGAAIGDEAGAIIGAGVGAGAGYLIGNEIDKADAKNHDFNSPTPLSGTKWKVISLVPMPTPPFSEKTVEFGKDGIVTTVTKDLEGLVTRTEERYRIVDNVLIVNKPGYLINAEFSVDATQLIVKTDEFRAVLNAM